MITVFVRLPSPLGSLQLRVEPETPLSALVPDFADKDVYFRSARILSPDTPACQAPFVELCPRLRGGKGGFGTNLRAAGGRMSMGKANNTDACRDLSGRRLSTLKEAQRQADLIDSTDTLRAQAVAEEKAKLESLERSLGLSAGDKRVAEVDVEELARKRIRFEDNKFLEESRELNESVRSAVSAAMLKKKKKKDTKVAVEAVKKAEDKAMMPPPAIATKAA